VLSQVVLSLQLPFAIIPLIHFVSDRRRMHDFTIKPWIKLLSWVVAVIIIALNANLVRDEISRAMADAGDQAWLIWMLLVPLMLAVGALLLYVTFRPWLAGKAPALLGRAGRVGVHGPEAAPEAGVVTPPPYHRIAVAFDFAGGEERLLGEALRMADPEQTRVLLLHVVESPVARALGRDAADREVRADRRRLEELAHLLQQAGVETECHLGAGDPASELARMVNDLGADMVILGGHGHSGLSDLMHGATVDSLRHRVHASVLVVYLGAS